MGLVDRVTFAYVKSQKFSKVRVYSEDVTDRRARFPIASFYDAFDHADAIAPDAVLTSRDPQEQTFLAAELELTEPV